jgi:tetratricopeptide (TPR) repeat protein
MKHLLLTLHFFSLCFLLSEPTFSQSFSESTGIEFTELDWTQTKEIAQSIKRPILMVVYKPYSTECKTMNNTTFADVEVEAFYESYFVSAKLNVHTHEGMKFRSEYKLSEYPALLYFTADGKLIQKDAGVKSAEELISLGESVLAKVPNNTDNTIPSIYTSFLEKKLQYINGSRTPRFLYDYAYDLKKLNETYSEVVDYFLNSSDFKTSQSIRDNMQFVFDFADELDSKAFDIMLRNKQQYMGVFGKDEVNAKILDAVRSKVILSALDQNKTAFEDALQYITKAAIPNSQESIFKFKLLYYKETNNLLSYVQAVTNYCNIQIAPNPDILNTAARDLAVNTNNKEQLEKALQWISKSLSISNSHFEYNETIALIFYKLGKKSKAIKELDIAIEKARKSGGDYSNSLQLQEIIRADKAIPASFK